VALDILELEIDDGNEQEFAEHGVTALEIFQLLDGRIRVFQNRRDRAADWLIIGQTHGGRTLSVPIVSTAVEGRWRPATAWESTSAERERYEKS
jgi:uncharacterized DUF497 family protein